MRDWIAHARTRRLPLLENVKGAQDDKSAAAAAADPHPQKNVKHLNKQIFRKFAKIGFGIDFSPILDLD